MKQKKLKKYNKLFLQWDKSVTHESSDNSNIMMTQDWALFWFKDDGIQITAEELR